MTDAENPFHRAVYLTGPTASGKTAVGVALAKRIDAEVVALDSMTLYRGMDVLTAKPTPPERAGVPHHLIDVLDPWDSASVADYRAWAVSAVSDIEGRGRKVLFVGGTPLYLKALLRGLFDGPGADAGLRAELEQDADRIGDDAMQRRLAAVDPSSALRLHPNDRRRVLRALEVVTTSGRPISSFQNEHQPAPPEVRVFALERPRDELCSRIDARVVRMFDDGLVDEVRALQSGVLPVHPVPAQGVGYCEVEALLDGRATFAETLSRIQARTRQFAKRQATWFRGLAEVRPWKLSGDEPAEVTAEALARRLFP